MTTFGKIAAPSGDVANRHEGPAVDGAALDHALATGRLRFDADLASRYAVAMNAHAEAPTLTALKARSMLAVESLLMIRAFALAAPGMVVEVGAYWGGATVAAALGLKAAGRGHVVAVDRGGAYLTHPQLPTADIYADWQRTVDAFGVADWATLIKGNLDHEAVRQRLRDACGDAPIRLVIVDADGYVFAHLSAVLDRLAPDCLIVVDDYVAHDAAGGSQAPKMSRTSQIMDRALERGALETYAVLPWCTWFGRATPYFKAVAPALAEIEIAERNAFLMARDGNLDNRHPPGGFQPLY